MKSNSYILHGAFAYPLWIGGCCFDRIIQMKNVGLNVALNKTEKKVVSLLIEDSEYTSDELAAKIGVTKRTIERAFISLQNKKVIERIGSKRDGSWIVMKH